MHTHSEAAAARVTNNAIGDDVEGTAIHREWRGFRIDRISVKKGKERTKNKKEEEEEEKNHHCIF